MKLMDILAARTFVLKHHLKENSLLWNDIYDLLARHSSCTPKQSSFVKSINSNTARIYQSSVNSNSVFIHLQINKISRIGFLLIRFSKSIKIDKENDNVKFLYLLLTDEPTMFNDQGINEFLKLYNSVSIEDILENSKDQYQAFHMFKQFLNFSEKSTNELSSFEVFGTEEEE